LLSINGTIGNVAFFNNEKIILGKSVAYINLHESVDKQYIYWIIQSDCIKQYFENELTGSTIRNLGLGSIRCTLIPLPPLPEQTAIATALSDMDEYILSLERLIAKKKAIKQGTMQNLLTGKIRLKGFKGEWVEKKLGKCGIITSSGVDKKIVQNEKPITLLNYLDVYRNTYIKRSLLSHVVTAPNEKIKNCSVQKGDVFFTPTSETPNDIAKTAVSLETMNDVVYSYHLVRLRPYVDYNGEFIKYACDTNDFVQQAERFADGSGTRYVISIKKFNEMTILIPPSFTEQTYIANILSNMDAEIEALQAKLQKTKLVKQGAMQELLTGKIRLSTDNQTQSAKKMPKQANVHFRRSVWAAEIADRLCNEPTFGHVKMEKLLFLTENMCGIDIGSKYHRDVAGPYDNRAIRSIDSQLKKQNWFEVERRDKGYRYVPMTKRGGHKNYFNKYYSDTLPVFDKVINTLRNWDTERCEIVATLYSAWKDLANAKQQYTDNDIINEVINNWNESKKRISEERWQKALDWMRKNGFAPI
jgi:type I restriction enzyme S subunit